MEFKGRETLVSIFDYSFGSYFTHDLRKDVHQIEYVRKYFLA